MLETVKCWKLTLEYDGSRYSGWQEQTNARTVAGELRKVAEDFLGGRCDIGGSGRTDAGVHAHAQVAHIKARGRQRVSPEQLFRVLNDRLPYDIAVLSLEEAPPRFHARHDAVARRYIYRISTRKDAFSKKFVWWVKDPLNFDAMIEANASIAGRHNFIRFRAKDDARPDESTIVVVNSSTLTSHGGLILFEIEASHFLWRMVRRLAGSLVKTGLGEISPAAFANLVNNRGPAHDVPAWTAPSSGLFLEEVIYRR